MKLLKKFTILIYLISLKHAYAADVEISGTQTTREDLQASSTLTISGTLDGDLNNIVRGYIAAGNEIDSATVVVESGGPQSCQHFTYVGFVLLNRIRRYQYII